MPPFLGFLVLCVVLFVLGITLWAIIEIVRREDLDAGAKGIWVLVVLLFPFIGALVYLMGMAPKDQKANLPPPKTFDKNLPRPTSTRPPGPRG